MHYVTVEGLSKSYGEKPLFENISFHIEEGDKIALVALNGSGKSTLLKILTGTEHPDEGKVWIHKDVTVVMLEQSSRHEPGETVLENIFDHDHPILNAIKEYEALTDPDAPEPDAAILSAAV